MQQTIQTARKTEHAFANSLRWDAVLTETANSRPGETRDSGGFTRSRSGEAFSPERD